MVTSLHDGMNLVARRYVASREDERGVLILSTFAGAAHELSDALLVNPYDVAQLSESIHRALEMPEEEQTRRMQRMRHIVREHNVYRWAANLLSDLTEIRVDLQEPWRRPRYHESSKSTRCPVLRRCGALPYFPGWRKLPREHAETPFESSPFLSHAHRQQSAGTLASC